MNSNEREERLKQIREKRYAATLPANQRGLLPTASWVDVDFLLAEIDRRPLRDSAGCEYHLLECSVDESGCDCTCGAYGRNQSHLRDADAATRMRDKCVEKVRAIAEKFERESFAEAGNQRLIEKTRIDTARVIAKELESLTLDQVERKQS